MQRQLSVTVQPVEYFPMRWPTTYRVTAEVDGPIELDDSDLEAAVSHAISRQHLIARVVPAYCPPAEEPRPSAVCGPRPSQNNGGPENRGPAKPQATRTTPGATA